MNTTHSTKKKLFAQALGITAAAVLGVLANAGTAAADGHNVVDPDATWGDPDGAEVREMSWAPAVDSYDTSSYPAAPSWPAGSGAYNVHASTPVSSYPADPSWPDRGWGVADN
jgi:hypothetical protein